MQEPAPPPSGLLTRAADARRQTASSCWRGLPWTAAMRSHHHQQQAFASSSSLPSVVACRLLCRRLTCVLQLSPTSSFAQRSGGGC